MVGMCRAADTCSSCRRAPEPFRNPRRGRKRSAPEAPKPRRRNDWVGSAIPSPTPRHRPCEIDTRTDAAQPGGWRFHAAVRWPSRQRMIVVEADGKYQRYADNGLRGTSADLTTTGRDRHAKGDGRRRRRAVAAASGVCAVCASCGTVARTSRFGAETPVGPDFGAYVPCSARGQEDGCGWSARVYHRCVPRTRTDVRSTARSHALLR